MLLLLAMLLAFCIALNGKIASLLCDFLDAVPQMATEKRN